MSDCSTTLGNSWDLHPPPPLFCRKKNSEDDDNRFKLKVLKCGLFALNIRKTQQEQNNAKQPVVNFFEIFPAPEERSLTFMFLRTFHNCNIRNKQRTKQTDTSVLVILTIEIKVHLKRQGKIT